MAQRLKHPRSRANYSPQMVQPPQTPGRPITKPGHTVQTQVAGHTPNQTQAAGPTTTRPPNVTVVSGHVPAGKPKAKAKPKPPKKGKGKAPGKPKPPNYGAPLPYSQIVGNANAAAQQRYGPVQAQQALQGREIPAWFSAYRDSLTGGQAQAQASYQPAINQQNALAQQTGQSLGLQGPAGETDQLAAAGREALAHLGLAQLQNALSQTTNYYAGRQGVANAAQIGANTQLASARQQTARDKGAYRQTQIEQGVQTERNYGISQQHQTAENAAFGVNVYKAKTAAQQAAARLAETKRRDRAAARARKQTQKLEGKKFKSAQAKDAYERAHGLGPYKPSRPAKSPSAYTPKDTLAAKKSLRTSVALVRSGLNQPGGRAPDYWSKAFDQLVSEKVDPAIARAAIQLVRGGKVGPHTRRTLHDDYGITSYPGGTKKKPAPGTSTGGGGGPHGSGRP